MAKRFTVTVEQEFIVYADCPEEAETKTIAHLRAITSEQPASRPIKCKVVEVAPPVGGHIDCIDAALGVLPGKA